MPDQYTRTRAQLGTPALDVLRRAHVAVFGIGGVGGQAVEVLARSGVGELSLFDSDTVALSNLNRQLVALHSTLGQYKVDAMAARIADIDPTIIVHANRMFYNAETAPDVDLMQFDYVLDCIDTVSAKLLLIRCCKKAGVPILCSMGAANKLDPTAFRVADIEKTTVDPLAKVIRLECRKRRLGKVKVVFSEEQTLPPLQDEIEEAPTAARRTVPASNAFVPAACGLRQSVLMQDPTLFLFRQFHKRSFFPGPAAGPFSISIIKRQNPFGKSSAFVYNYRATPHNSRLTA